MLYSPRRARQFLHPLKRCHRSTISSTTSSIAGGTRHRSYRRVSTGISLHYQRPVLSMILTNKVRDLSGSGSKINAGILCVPCKARTSTILLCLSKQEGRRRMVARNTHARRYKSPREWSLLSWVIISQYERPSLENWQQLDEREQGKAWGRGKKLTNRKKTTGWLERSMLDRIIRLVNGFNDQPRCLS